MQLSESEFRAKLSELNEAAIITVAVHLYLFLVSDANYTQTGIVPDGRDQIPAGTFSSSDIWTKEKVSAVFGVQRLGSLLADQHPEIGEMYLDLEQYWRNEEIAKIYLPELHRDYPYFAAKVVGYAIRLLLDPARLAETTSKRKQQALERIIDQVFGGKGSEAHIQHQRAAAKKRHQKDIGVDVDALLAGRGRIAWSQDEFAMLIEILIEDVDFKTARGAPDYIKIAAILNDMYHDGKPVRYENSVRSMVAGYRRGKVSKQNKMSPA